MIPPHYWQTPISTPGFPDKAGTLYGSEVLWEFYIYENDPSPSKAYNFYPMYSEEGSSPLGLSLETIINNKFGWRFSKKGNITAIDPIYLHHTAINIKNDFDITFNYAGNPYAVLIRKK